MLMSFGRSATRAAGLLAALAATTWSVAAAAQQKTEVSLSRQPGIFYMPSHII